MTYLGLVCHRKGVIVYRISCLFVIGYGDEVLHQNVILGPPLCKMADVCEINSKCNLKQKELPEDIWDK